MKLWLSHQGPLSKGGWEVGVGILVISLLSCLSDKEQRYVSENKVNNFLKTSYSTVFIRTFMYATPKVCCGIYLLQRWWSRWQLNTVV